MTTATITISNIDLTEANATTFNRELNAFAYKLQEKYPELIIHIGKWYEDGGCSNTLV